MYQPPGHDLLIALNQLAHVTVRKLDPDDPMPIVNGYGFCSLQTSSKAVQGFCWFDEISQSWFMQYLPKSRLLVAKMPSADAICSELKRLCTPVKAFMPTIQFNRLIGEYIDDLYDGLTDCGYDAFSYALSLSGESRLIVATGTTRWLLFFCQGRPKPFVATCMGTDYWLEADSLLQAVAMSLDLSPIKL